MRSITKVVIAVVMLASGGFSSLQADVVVNWGGDYVAHDDQNLAGNLVLGTISGSHGYSGTPFSASTAFSPPISGDYAGSSARFFGGAILGHENSMSPDAFGDARIKNQGGTDSVQLKATQSGHSHNMHAIFLWRQDDFLTGDNPVSFNAETTASIKLGQASTETLNNASLRLLVRDSQGYWLSEHSFTGLSNNSTYVWDSINQGFAAGTDGEWAEYDPTSALAGLEAGTDLHFSGTGFGDKKFTGVNGIGFLFEQDIFHNNLEFHFESFNVNAVPEPN